MLRILYAASHWGVEKEGERKGLRSEATLVPRLWRESFSARPSCGFGRAAEASTIAENKQATTRNERAMVSSAGACVV